MNIKANLIDIPNQNIYPAEVTIENGKIAAINPLEEEQELYILPGFVDAHVHIESSMIVPTEFARMAVVHGTIATISDPHEIANVLGIEGVRFMIENGNQAALKFYFGAPSCVPATTFETAGATLGVAEVEELLKMPEVKYLAEMMNWPGVLHGDSEVMAKIALAQKYNKPVDGHAPGLKGEQAAQYIAAGISTDHECFTAEEALDKLKHGMKILIREGSAARNFEALVGLINIHWEEMMFCSDDKHPDSLLEGHINQLVKRALEKGLDLFKVLQMACINPVKHYDLEVGLLNIGDPADFILVSDLWECTVEATYINGEKVAEKGKTLLTSKPCTTPNNFKVGPKRESDFQVKHESPSIKVIECIDGELITNKLSFAPKVEDGFCVSDTKRDLLKIAVVNRYQEAPVATAFIKNFGLQTGAIASSVAHDSHNIIVVGVEDDAITKAVNVLIECRGGMSAVSREGIQVIPLPVAGLMSDKDGYEVAQDYIKIDKMAKEMGSQLGSPFMSLSFMALLVIPALKLSDLGLFDGERFEFV